MKQKDLKLPDGIVADEIDDLDAKSDYEEMPHEQKLEESFPPELRKILNTLDLGSEAYEALVARHIYDQDQVPVKLRELLDNEQKTAEERIIVINGMSSETLCFTITGFSQATGIGTSTLYDDAKSGRLKTRLLGVGKRKKRLILREDGIEYLESIPSASSRHE